MKINGQHLISNLQAYDMESLRCLVERHHSDGNCRLDRPLPKTVAKTLERIFELTLTSITGYNITGGGRPLLLSNSPQAISTGGFSNKDNRWDEKEKWLEGCETWSNLKLREIMKKLCDRVDGSKVIPFLLDLCDHVFEKASHIASVSVVDIEYNDDLDFMNEASDTDESESESVLSGSSLLFDVDEDLNEMEDIVESFL